jgi:DNA-3-methyladenine glycosylase I
MKKLKRRCAWGESNDLMLAYHDKEWGLPTHDDKVLFEFLILEGMQAGLSWNLILQKRENFRKAFDNFDYEKISLYSDKKINDLLENPGIIRNKLKINSVIINAHAFLKVREEFGTFDSYIWIFVNHKPIQNKWKKLEEIPGKIDLSDKISEDLKKRGFKFIGSTTVYAFMQAIGMVNDHEISCFRYIECQG